LTYIQDNLYSHFYSQLHFGQFTAYKSVPVGTSDASDDYQRNPHEKRASYARVMTTIITELSLLEAVSAAGLSRWIPMAVPMNTGERTLLVRHRKLQVCHARCTEESLHYDSRVQARHGLPGCRHVPRLQGQERGADVDGPRSIPRHSIPELVRQDKMCTSTTGSLLLDENSESE
jgi:hypothetical protein